MKHQSPPGTTFAEKLLKYTERDPITGCLNWTASLSNGYGQHGTPGVPRLAHIAAWELANGPRPPGAVVRHRCHNPRCTEATHLVIGTQADNMTDMREAGRGALGAMRPNTKLSDDQVRAIRADTRPLGIIAAEYGIHYQTVYRVRRGTRRNHVA